MSKNKNNNKAQIGIGTLIIFIAMVLTAAIAAGVLINTVSHLEQQSLQTSEQSISQASTHVDIKNVVGEITENQTTNEKYISKLSFEIQLLPGAQNIDLTESTILLHSENIYQNLIIGKDETNIQEIIENNTNSETNLLINNNETLNPQLYPSTSVRASNIQTQAYNESTITNVPYRFGVEKIIAESNDLMLTDKSDRYRININTSTKQDTTINSSKIQGTHLEPIKPGEQIRISFTTQVGTTQTKVITIPDTFANKNDGQIISI